MKESVTSVLASTSRQGTYQKNVQSAVRKATTEPTSITQRHREAAARTEEDDGAEIGPHQAGGEGVSSTLLGRESTEIIHGDCWISDGPAKEEREEEEVEMWWWYKHKGGWI